MVSRSANPLVTCALLEPEKIAPPLRSMIDWIEAWYNPRRRRSYFEMLSPIDYETTNAAHAA